LLRRKDEDITRLVSDVNAARRDLSMIPRHGDADRRPLICRCCLFGPCPLPFAGSLQTRLWTRTASCASSSAQNRRAKSPTHEWKRLARRALRRWTSCEPPTRSCKSSSSSSRRTSTCRRFFVPLWPAVGQGELAVARLGPSAPVPLLQGGSPGSRPAPQHARRPHRAGRGGRGRCSGSCRDGRLGAAGRPAPRRTCYCGRLPSQDR
jgi:hypothetical protein